MVDMPGVDLSLMMRTGMAMEDMPGVALSLMMRTGMAMVDMPGVALSLMMRTGMAMVDMPGVDLNLMLDMVLRIGPATVPLIVDMGLCKKYIYGLSNFSEIYNCFR